MKNSKAKIILLILAGGACFISFCHAQSNSLIQFTATNFFVNASAGQVIVTVQRVANSATNYNTDVDYYTLDGTALSPSNYVTTQGTLKWSVFETCAKSFSVPILGTGGLTNPYFSLYLSTGPTQGPTGLLYNESDNEIFVSYNGTTIGIPPEATEQNVRRDWLPDDLPAGLEFMLEALPAGFGAASNGTVTLTSGYPNLKSFVSPQSPTVISSNGFAMSFLLVTGTNYVIETSTNLSNWVGMTNFVCDCATNSFLDVTATNKSIGFYRAISQ